METCYRNIKYYDWARQKILTETDGCDYEKWPQQFHEFLFTFHPAGFRVFLPPSKLQDCDEYSSGDPYTVNISTEFHKRRSECTIDLIRVAVGNKEPKPKILDIGCGKGYITGAIKDNFPDADVSGFDYSLTAINHAANKFPGIDFCVADAYSPPYCQNYFDVIICNNLWEHVPDPLYLLSSIKKVLKPNGFLIISTPSRYRFENVIRALSGKSLVLISKFHVTEYSVGQVVEQLKYGEFEIEKIFSKSIDIKAKTIKRCIAYKLILPILKFCYRIVNSQHTLESTVFFLARKIEKYD